MKLPAFARYTALAVVIVSCASTAYTSTMQESASIEEEALSKDSRVAQRALERSIRLKDAKAIRVSLDHNSPKIKRMAVEALEELGDEASVPALIRVLEAYQYEMRGGTEIRIYRENLTRSLVSALKNLIGDPFYTEDPPSEADIAKVLRESKAWWEIHRGRFEH
jgi:HEAT repeat protein